MGKFIEAIKRGAQNGGRKTVVGGEMVAEYATDKDTHLYIARNAQKLQGKGVKDK